jgi:uncharacterized protein
VSLNARFLAGIGEIDASAWNALVNGTQPFVKHEFLHALELSGCAVARTGWKPRHLVIHDAGGHLVGAAPLYEKTHSRGEFVFDFSWANAYAQQGLHYYPKLLCAVPFTPVEGSRLLVAAGGERELVQRTLVEQMREFTVSQQLSSCHVLFPAAQQAEQFAAAGMIMRRDCQFHWSNAGYASFEDFLATFTAEKRKKVKRERRRVAEAGISFETRFGGDVDAKLWRALFQFYADTFHRHGHEPYLNLDFFRRIGASLPHQLMLKIAVHDGEPIAVAIFFRDADALYGRYWGAGGNFHSLHFETCYYQGIDFCIEHGLKRFEPGTQGEHKVPRGFVPVITASAHYVVEPRFAAAIRDFAAREARGVDQYAAAVNEHLPYHKESAEVLGLEFES